MNKPHLRGMVSKAVPLYLVFILISTLFFGLATTPVLSWESGDESILAFSYHTCFNDGVLYNDSYVNDWLDLSYKTGNINCSIELNNSDSHSYKVFEVYDDDGLGFMYHNYTYDPDCIMTRLQYDFRFDRDWLSEGAYLYIKLYNASDAAIFHIVYRFMATYVALQVYNHGGDDPIVIQNFDLDYGNITDEKFGFILNINVEDSGFFTGFVGEESNHIYIEDLYAVVTDDDRVVYSKWDTNSPNGIDYSLLSCEMQCCNGYYDEVYFENGHMRSMGSNYSSNKESWGTNDFCDTTVFVDAGNFQNGFLTVHNTDMPTDLHSLHLMVGIPFAVPLFSANAIVAQTQLSIEESGSENYHYCGFVDVIDPKPYTYSSAETGILRIYELLWHDINHQYNLGEIENTWIHIMNPVSVSSSSELYVMSFHQPFSGGSCDYSDFGNGPAFGATMDYTTIKPSAME